MKRLTSYILYLIFSIATNFCLANAIGNNSDSLRAPISHIKLELQPDATIQVQNLTVSLSDTISFFQLCSSFTNETLTFLNASATLSTNKSYNINWGDGTQEFQTTNWTAKTHNYAAGHWILKYTVVGQTNISTTKIYHIYIVSNPAVSLGSPGNTDNCSNVPLTFPITGTENNPPGTTYTVTFNDGSAPIIYKKSPPKEITHIFTKTSCGVTSYNGATSYPNSFSASIVASNSCGVSAVNVVPIYISTSPVVNFDLPKSATSTNKPLYLTNATTGYVNVGANCAVVPKLVWKITPATGFTLSSGSLGNDFNSDNSALWTKGTDIITPVFTVPGIYTIKLRVDTKRCGNDSIVKTVCVENPLIPQFNIDATNGCSPLHVSAINSTDLSGSCSVTANWSVSYLSANCGNAPAIWSFADGTTALTSDAAFNFVTPGTYKIILKMTNSAGSFNLEKTITVKQPPTATIKAISDNCGSAAVQPIANVSSCAPQSSVLSYKWDFPGGIPTTATTLDPGIIKYNSVGSYTASLTVTNECGSVTVNSNTFHVIPLPEVEVINNQLKSNGELSDQIIFQGTSGAIFEWTNNNTAIGLSAFGTGTINSFILRNGSDSVVTARISVTPKLLSTGCIGLPKIFTIKVNPTADVNPIDNQVVNNGEATKKIEFSTVRTGGNTTYKWTNSSPEIGLTAFGVGNINSFVAQNTSNSPIAATITVTPIFENGGQSLEGVPKIFTLTVNPTAHVNSLSNIELCNGITTQEIIFDTKNLEGISTYSWTNDNPNIGLQATGTGSLRSFKLINLGSDQQIAHITVIPTFIFKGISNIGPAEHFNIVVNPAPVFTSQPISSFICPGGAVSPLKVIYNGGVGTPAYRWYSNKIKSTIGANPIQNATADTYVPSAEFSGTTYYFCIISLPSGVCSNITSDIATVTVNDAAIIIQQPEKLQNLCVGGTISNPLSILYSGGSGLPAYQWYTNASNSISGGIPIVGANDSTYLPPVFTTAGNYFYYLQLTLSGDGCGAIFSQVAEVRVVSDPSIVEQPLASQMICKDITATDLVVAATGGLGSYSYQWFENTVNDISSGKLIQGALFNVFSPSTVSTGTTYYYCEISQPNGLNCKVTSQTAEVVVNPLPVITKQPISNAVCYGNSLEQLNISYSNGVGKPTYQWYSSPTNSIGTGSIIPNAITNVYKPDSSKIGTTYYYCEINFNDGGCLPLTSSIASVTVNPVAKITSQNIMISNGSSFTISPTQINGDIVPNGTNYIWANPLVSPLKSLTGATAQSIPISEISQKLNNLTDSIATVIYTVTPITGLCVGADFKVEVKVLPTLKQNVILKNISCFGAADGSIQLNIIGGMPLTTTDGYIIQWTGPNGFTATTKDIIGLKPGEYNVTITDAGGNPVTTKYTITEPVEIHINTDVKRDVNCSGNNNGKLSVTVTGGTPPYKYSWQRDGVYFANTEDITDLVRGVYVLTLTDANGCGLATEAYNINEPPTLDVKLVSKSDITCFGDSTGSINIEVKGGTPIEKTLSIFDYNYTWSGPNGYMSFSKNIKNLIAGIYKLTVTDANNCSQTFEIQINQSSELMISTVITPITCYGSNNASIALTISGGAKPYQIKWSNLGSGLIQENLSKGDYTVTVTDANNCQKTVVVNIPDADFSIHPVVKNISCHGANDGSIRLNITGGVQPVTLVWADNPDAGNTRNQLSPGIYSVTLRDGAPCSITESYLISEPEELNMSAKITNAFECDNQTSGSIDVSVRGGTAPYSFQWSNGATSEDLKNISVGIYYVIVTDSKGCSKSGKFEIHQQAPIRVSVSSALSFDCKLNKMKSKCKALVEGGFPPYIMHWSVGAVSGVNNETTEISQNGIVDLQVIDSMGCSANYTFNVDIPTVGMTYSLVECNKFYYQFNSIKSDITIDNMAFLWEFGDGITSTERNPLHFFNSSGTFKIKLTVSTADCSANFEDIVYADSRSKLKLDREAKLCIGDSVVLRVSGADKYRWSDGTFVDSITIKHPGEYIVIGTSLAGCIDTLNFTATYYGLYNYTIQSDSDKVTSGGFPLHLWSDNIPFSQYYWDFGDGKIDQGVDVHHEFNIQKDGFYDVKLRVVNPNGCIENVTKRIWITVPGLPNTFSPNNDGINDLFLQNWLVKVYSRNGVLLYEGRDGWDGKYKGQEVSTGVYFYVLYYPSETGTKTTSGYVRLIR